MDSFKKSDSSTKEKHKYGPFPNKPAYNLVVINRTSHRHRQIVVGLVVLFCFLVFTFLHHYPHGEVLEFEGITTATVASDGRGTSSYSASSPSAMRGTGEGVGNKKRVGMGIGVSNILHRLQSDLHMENQDYASTSTGNNLDYLEQRIDYNNRQKGDMKTNRIFAEPQPLGKIEASLDVMPKDPYRKKIAFAISVTSDGPYVDGAAVLGFGIHKAMKQSIYDYDLVAIVHPDVVKARKPLEKAGWQILERDVPLNINDIQGDYLREKIRKNGCCGAHELIKLYAWTLLDYHRVVHLDMDSMILQPMDELFEGDRHLIYTCDYGMMPKGVPACPVQGGFLVVKPSMEEFKELVNVVLEGDYRDGSAWGGTRIGWFWGGMTIQGLLPYFFTQLKDLVESEEVDRCFYNNMFDNPKCKNIEPYHVKNVHFTVCQKPWTCTRADRNFACNTFHDIWLKLRYELEVEVGGNPDIIPKPACHGGRYTPLVYLKE